mgnify:CR=1 FL=1
MSAGLPCALLRRQGAPWFNEIPVGKLCRAFVSLPPQLCPVGRPMAERTVFFECKPGVGAAQHLEQLLALAWCVDTTGWAEKGFIYNVFSAAELMRERWSPDDDDDGDESPLVLFECGWGGPGGIGPEHTHYSRVQDCDLFVTPRVWMVLVSALAEIELLYAEQIPVGEVTESDFGDLASPFVTPGGAHTQAAASSAPDARLLS